MQRSFSEERVTFRSGALDLEGRFHAPPGATRAAIVCHPHPQYGGNMNNSVVCAAASHLSARGIAALRFNFRGVGGSAGVYDGGSGEVDDARAAIDWLRRRIPDASIALGGYSFGAIVALRAGHDRADVERLFAIALPVTMFDGGSIAASRKPKLFLAGDHDAYCPLTALEALIPTLAGESSLHRLPGADHFLGGYEDDVGEAVASFVGGAV
jgi:alpha/beta superfamily hydrolase